MWNYATNRYTFWKRCLRNDQKRQTTLQHNAENNFGPQESLENSQ